MQKHKVIQAMSLLISIVIVRISVAGDVEGLVHFSLSMDRTLMVPSRYNFEHTPQMTTRHKTPAVKAVIYIADPFPDSTFSIAARHPIMDQRNESFIPYILPILVGTTVDFPNNDKVYHNVFSFSKTKTFDLGKYPTGTSKQVTFERIGVVSLYCEIHSHMNAFILVLPNPYFASVREDGRFTIRNVPAGKYHLKAFFGRAPEIGQKITVKRKGITRVELFQ